ncbi:hypothetical protein PO909_003408 [Leuciscus waleckii]
MGYAKLLLRYSGIRAGSVILEFHRCRCPRMRDGSGDSDVEEAELMSRASEEHLLLLSVVLNERQ